MFPEQSILSVTDQTSLVSPWSDYPGSILLVKTIGDILYRIT